MVNKRKIIAPDILIEGYDRPYDCEEMKIDEKTIRCRSGVAVFQFNRDSNKYLKSRVDAFAYPHIFSDMWIELGECQGFENK